MLKAAPQPSDQAARDRFVTQLDRSFSVLAPAGVGKTRAIVQRVVRLATGPQVPSLLSKLAVVTYTNKAADEMQERARNALLETAAGAARMGEFNRAFFGTIHSFCLNLLMPYGHYLGLPGEIELLEGDAEEAAWARFFRGFELAGVDTGLSAADLARCFRHLPVQDVVGLARSARPDSRPPPAPWPEPDLSALLGFAPDGRNKAYVTAGQALLRRWQADYANGIGYLPLPEYGNGGQAFQDVWQRTFGPVRRWLAHAALAIASAVAAAYQRFRIAQGQLTYADQIGLVRVLLAHPEAGPQLRAQGFRVILDEAQDTDPDQFRVLLELARPPDARGEWLVDGGPPPQPGRFCMVGDPQQSIYSGRADLAFYRQVRDSLLAQQAAEELEFDVTFRCSRSVIRTANALCPPMLNGAAGQVAYVPLNPRPEAGEGQVVRLTLAAVSAPRPERPARKAGRAARQAAPADDDGRRPIGDQARAEATQLAAWLAGKSPAELGARDWSEVAVLCARRRWIEPLESALRDAAIPVQNHSRRQIQGDDPCIAWVAAIVACLADPLDGFEIVGVLREVFGLSDHDLHAFSGGDGSVFQVRVETAQAGPVARALNELCGLRREVAVLPLFDAARRVLERARLRERILAIAPGRATPLDRATAMLLTRAAEAEADGLSLAEWAELLRDLYVAPAAPAPPEEDAVQIITCHAAKGLEWDVVILPFLFRALAQRGTTYPYLAEDRKTGQASVLFGKEWQDAAQAEQIKRGIVQENQRLLYVALTRARHTLVLVDDATLMPRAKDSFAACLGFAEQSPPPAWTDLPTDLSAAPVVPAPAAEAELADIPRLHPAEVVAATQRALLFPRRILPHALAQRQADAEPEREHERDPEWPGSAAGPAIRYGLWWHELMQGLDWPKQENWTPRFDALVGRSPDPARARREWAQFRGSELAGQLSRPGLTLHVEMPFVRPLDGARCSEGFLDLAAFDTARRAWLLVDWKTNRLGPDELDDLRATYAPQLRAYADALRAATGVAAVTAVLYSTALGQSVQVQTEGV